MFKLLSILLIFILVCVILQSLANIGAKTYYYMTEESSDLYLWTPSSFSVGLGHISLGLPNGVYISFWPATGTGKYDIKYEQCRSKLYATLSDEIGEKRYPDVSVKIYKLNVSAITIWWNNFVKEAAAYDVWSQNCAIVVRKALSKGSSYFSDLDHIITPRGLFKIVTEGYVGGKQLSHVPEYGHYVLLLIIRYCLLYRYLGHKNVIKPIARTVGGCLQKIVPEGYVNDQQLSQIVEYCQYVLLFLISCFLLSMCVSNVIKVITRTVGGYLRYCSGSVDSSALKHATEPVYARRDSVEVETEEPGELDYIKPGRTELELQSPAPLNENKVADIENMKKVLDVK